MKSGIFSMIAPVVSLCIALTACTSTTVINSRPQGARVYINDEYRGLTPCAYSDTRISWSENRLKLSKEGYRDFRTSFRRDEKFSAPACCGGLLIIVPFLWLFDYNPERTYDLEHDKQYGPQ